MDILSFLKRYHQRAAGRPGPLPTYRANFVYDIDRIERYSGVVRITEGVDWFTVHLVNGDREWVPKEGVMHVHEEYQEEETVGEIQENL